jgi:hypothetical protein
MTAHHAACRFSATIEKDDIAVLHMLRGLCQHCESGKYKQISIPPGHPGSAAQEEQRPEPRAVKWLTWALRVERVKGIEPSLSAWEADVLPLNYTRKRTPLYLVGQPTRTQVAARLTLRAGGSATAGEPRRNTTVIRASLKLL